MTMNLGSVSSAAGSSSSNTNNCNGITQYKQEPLLNNLKMEGHDLLMMNNNGMMMMRNHQPSSQPSISSSSSMLTTTESGMSSVSDGMNPSPSSPSTTTTVTSAHIPLKSFLIKAFPFQVNCIGCNQSFPCYYTPKGFKKIPSPAYYVHCIDQCEAYRAKDLIRVCEYCSFKFLDKEALGIHKNSCKDNNKRQLLAQKPHWMPISIILTIINYSKFDGTTSCRGCKRMFPCYRKGSKVVPSLEYYVHCIEQCKEYQQKGWMRVCPVCNCKFLNNQALVQHKRGCYKTSQA